MLDPLKEAKAAQEELKASDAWKTFKLSKGSHIYKCNMHLNNVITALEARKFGEGRMGDGTLG